MHFTSYELAHYQDMGINELLLQRFFLIILKAINKDKIRLVSVNSFILYLTSHSIMQFRWFMMRYLAKFLIYLGEKFQGYS
jgi:hypothetical protein